MPTVLLAEDNPQVLELVSRILGDSGYDVIAARDGREAWATAPSRELRVGQHRLEGRDPPEPPNLRREPHGGTVVHGRVLQKTASRGHRLGGVPSRCIGGG